MTTNTVSAAPATPTAPAAAVAPATPATPAILAAAAPRAATESPAGLPKTRPAAGDHAAAGPATRNDPGRAAAFFAARLDFQTDVSDVHAGLASRHPGGGLSGGQGGGQGGAQGNEAGGGQGGGAGFVLIDSRSRAAWEQGHIPGAVHLPTAEIGRRAATLLDPAVPVVTYCWGPGCNGATRAALALALAGYSVKEMLGGVEYWVREGLPLRTPEGDVVADTDPLTAPVVQPSGPSCGC